LPLVGCNDRKPLINCLRLGRLAAHATCRWRPCKTKEAAAREGPHRLAGTTRTPTPPITLIRSSSARDWLASQQDEC
jgi:hypothetical protein